MPKASGETLIVRRELLDAILAVEGLLLDIDGVLVDTSQSYRLAVVEALKFFLERELRWDVDFMPFTPGEVDMFKRIGGFNNDWELAQAALLFVLFKGLRHGARRVSEIRRLPPTLEAFLAEVAGRGGGVVGAEAVALNSLELRQRRDLARSWKRRVIVQLAQEFYAGKRWCAHLFGYEPRYVPSEWGFLERERPILDISLLPPGLNLGVITGRSRRETAFALRRLGLTEKIPPASWVTDEDLFRKPDPRALAILMERLQIQSALYVGDTIDDLQMVNDYKERRRSLDPFVYSGMVLTGPNGEKNRTLFLERGADLVATDINLVLRFLESGRGSAGKS